MPFLYMKKRVIVISLGGSLIIPDKVDVNYLKNFKKTILKHTNKYKFIIVCGGGSTARKYISALKENNINPRLQSLAGISATRINARFMNYFFNKDSEKGIPHTFRQLKKQLKNILMLLVVVKVPLLLLNYLKVKVVLL